MHMGSVHKQQQQQPHVAFVPFPAHGHVAPHMQLARLLHARGFHVTIVHTELHHRRLLRANAAAAGDVVPGFGVEVIPDGLSLEAPPTTLAAHLEALEANCLEPFKRLLRDMADRPGSPPVSCVVADVPMSFAALAARAVGVPDVMFFTASACGLMGYSQFEELIRRGIVPINGDELELEMDAALDWVPGMKGMRLRDMPTFCHTTDADDALLRLHVDQMRVAAASTAIVLNTFYEMEKDVVDALAAFFPPVYTVGPLAAIVPAATGGDAAASLLQEDAGCMAWLDGKEARSVVYVSFGSHGAVDVDQIREFAAGLARCGSPYLWALRPDAGVEVAGGESDNDGLVVPWCAQEEVLAHPAVGLFVTHCGWNSILESVVAGVPVLGWPMMSEQTTNCRQVCMSWGIGAELSRKPRSDEIARRVRETMAATEARKKTLEWKLLAERATEEGGSSRSGVDNLVELLKGM